MADVGRNEPCPCGSGKKYKKCCLIKKSSSVSQALVYQRLRETEGKTMHKIDQYFMRRYSADALFAAWCEFQLWPEDEEALLPLDDAPEGEGMFAVWRQFSWLGEDLADTEDDVAPIAGLELPPGILADQYLEEKHVSPLERDFIQAAVATPWCFYQIMAVEEGESVTLKNLLSDTQVTVIERQASRADLIGMMIFTKVVHLHAIDFMLGCSPYPFERNEILSVLDFKEAVIGVGETWDNETLRDYEEELLGFYWLFRARLFNPVGPEIHNTDGDLLELHQLVYQLNCSTEDALQALKSLAQGLDAEDFQESADFNDAGDLLKVKFPWLKKGSRQRDDWDNTVMGHITLEPNKMVIEVNSRERAASIKRRIAQRLNKGRAKLLVDEIQSMESVIADAMNEVPDTSSMLERDDQVLAGIKEQAEWTHWRKWIDTAIPALDGLTPKEAAKSQSGKSRLESLLATFEFSTPEQSHWLHEQLGVDN